MEVEVVNLRDCKDWGKPGDVRIDRMSPWGNPFIMHEEAQRLEVIEKYEKYIAGQPDLVAELAKLQPKRLGCWCFPKVCHGHVLRKLLKEM